MVEDLSIITTTTTASLLLAELTASLVIISVSTRRRILFFGDTVQCKYISITRDLNITHPVCLKLFLTWNTPPLSQLLNEDLTCGIQKSYYLSNPELHIEGKAIRLAQVSIGRCD